MKNVKRHIHNRINYLVRYNIPTVGSFENWNTVHIAQLKLNSEVRNHIFNVQPTLINEAILK